MTGSPGAPEAEATRAVDWAPAVLERLELLLERAHGQRASRRLDLAGVRACVDEALDSPWGYAWRHGGEVGDPRSLTTVCLAVARDQEVVLGVGAARAQDVTPARAWPALGPWRLHDPPANVALLQRWARERAGDRVAVPRVPRAPVRDAEALLQRIRDRPGDDQARQVYADWLQERGDPRGEFIALQLAHGGRPGEAGARASALLEAHRDAWLGPLASAPVEFERGFVRRLTLGPDQAPLAAALLEREPVEQVVALGAVAGEAVAASSWMARVPGLELVRGPGELRVHGLQQMLDSPFLRRLRRLRIAGQPRTDGWLELLAQRWPSALPRLAALVLEECAFGDQDRQSLLAAPGLPRLDALVLTGIPLGAAGVVALARGPSPLRLAWLGLDRVSAGDAGAQALAASDRLGGLRVLSLQGNRLRARAVEALLDAPGLRGLAWLDVGDNPVGSRAHKAVATRFGARSPQPPAPW